MIFLTGRAVRISSLAEMMGVSTTWMLFAFWHHRSNACFSPSYNVLEELLPLMSK
jgi:hypothetical protein